METACPRCVAEAGGSVQDVCAAIGAVAPEQGDDDRATEARQYVADAADGVACACGLVDVPPC